MNSSNDVDQHYRRDLPPPCHRCGTLPSCIQGRNRLVGFGTPWCTVHFRGWREGVRVAIESGFLGTVSSQQRVRRIIWGKCSRGTEQCATISGTVKARQVRYHTTKPTKPRVKVSPVCAPFPGESLGCNTVCFPLTARIDSQSSHALGLDWLRTGAIGELTEIDVQEKQKGGPWSRRCRIKSKGFREDQGA